MRWGRRAASTLAVRLTLLMHLPLRLLPLLDRLSHELDVAFMTYYGIRLEHWGIPETLCPLPAVNTLAYFYLLF